VPQRIIEVSPSRPLRLPGWNGDDVFFVRQGLIAKYNFGSVARRQILAVRFAGEAIIPRPGVCDYGIQAVIKSDIIVIPRAGWDEAAETEPELAALLLRTLQRHEAIAHQWLLNCGAKDAASRIAHLICEIAARSPAADSHGFENPFTQQQFGELPGKPV